MNISYKQKIAISAASFISWRSGRPVYGLCDYRSKVRG